VGTITNRYDLYASSPNANNFFAGKVGIGTTTPVANLEVNGTTKFDGLVSFAGGQAFPGTGTVTSVASGLGLTGGPITGSGTLAINPAVVPQLTASSNTFTGSISASSFSGSGSALAGVNATTATSFTGSLAGEVTGTQSATVVSGAVSPNTANAIVRRDSSGNFSAGTVALAGNLALPSTASASLGVLTLGGAPFLHNFGGSNTFVGQSAGNMTMAGGDNSAFGFNALASNTTGGGNAAFGGASLSGNTIGQLNSAFGITALNNNKTGDGNAAFGYEALLTNTTGGANSAFGTGALFSNTTGGSNSAFGFDALKLLTSGDSNTAIGANAGFNLTTGSNNIYIGSLGPATAGSESNTIRIGSTQTSTFLAGTVTATKFLGDGSGLTGIASLGASNTFSGLETFAAAPSGGGVGQGSLYINPAAASAGQTLLGAAVNNVQQMRLDSGGNLTLAGTLGLPNTNTGGTTGVVFLGGTRFLHNFGINNTFVGALAGNMMMTGLGGNTGVGSGALTSNTTGESNSAFGFKALFNNSTGTVNSAFGYTALLNNTTCCNSAFGESALYSNTTGFRNSAFGIDALYSNTTGADNAAFGGLTLDVNTTGGFNSAFGDLALNFNSTGSGNTAVGYDAGVSATSANANTTGSNNTFLGAQAGPGLSLIHI